MERQGLVIVHTGDGKGKTTAALGLALRAWGSGLRVLILQFIKGGQRYGELDAIKALKSVRDTIEVRQCGLGFTRRDEKRKAEHIAAAKEAKENDAYQNTVFLGFDGIKSACEAILNDEETMSVSQDAYGMGYTAVDAAMTAVGGEMPDEVIYVEHELIDKDNAQARLEMLEGLE